MADRVNKEYLNFGVKYRKNLNLILKMKIKSVPILVVCLIIAVVVGVIVFVCYYKKKNNRLNNGRVISQQPMHVQTIFTPQPQPIIYNAYTSTMNDPLPPPYIPPSNKLPPFPKNNPKFNDYSNTTRTLQMKSENETQYPVLPQPFKSQDTNYL